MPHFGHVKSWVTRSFVNISFSRQLTLRTSVVGLVWNQTRRSSRGHLSSFKEGRVATRHGHCFFAATLHSRGQYSQNDTSHRPKKPARRFRTARSLPKWQRAPAGE